MSAAWEKVASPTQLGPIVSDGQVIGYVGRASGMKVGGKDFCVIAMDDYTLDDLAGEWLGITLDHSECRDAVFIQRRNYDALLTRLSALEAREKVLSAHEKWLVERIEWLRKEAHNGGHWEHLNARMTEAAYTLEKFRAALATGEAK